MPPVGARCRSFTSTKQVWTRTNSLASGLGCWMLREREASVLLASSLCKQKFLALRCLTRIFALLLCTYMRFLMSLNWIDFYALFVTCAWRHCSEVCRFWDNRPFLSFEMAFFDKIYAALYSRCSVQLFHERLVHFFEICASRNISFK